MSDRASLAAEYKAKIGYDPFEDDPSISEETVRQTLAEWDQEQILALARFDMYLRANGYTMVRYIDARRWVGLFRFAFTWAIIVGQIGDEFSYDDRWCYHTEDAAAKAMLEWGDKKYAGEPDGWHRHPRSGRRRSDTGEEYIAT